MCLVSSLCWRKEEVYVDDSLNLNIYTKFFHFEKVCFCFHGVFFNESWNETKLDEKINGLQQAVPWSGFFVPIEYFSQTKCLFTEVFCSTWLILSERFSVDCWIDVPLGCFCQTHYLNYRDNSLPQLGFCCFLSSVSKWKDWSKLIELIDFTKTRLYYGISRNIIIHCYFLSFHPLECFPIMH